LLARQSGLQGTFNVITITSVISRGRVGRLPIVIIKEACFRAENVAELEVKRKRADELKESVSAKRLRAYVAKIATLRSIRKT
jgi:hypothetical protein